MDLNISYTMGDLSNLISALPHQQNWHNNSLLLLPLR